MTTIPDREPRRSWTLADLVPVLEGAGYDVEGWDPALAQGGGSLTGRRERGGASRLIALDAGGRVRIVLARITDESARRTAVAGVPLRQVTERRQTVTLAGTLTDPEQLGPLLAALDRGLPEADDADGRAIGEVGPEP